MGRGEPHRIQSEKYKTICYKCCKNIFSNSSNAKCKYRHYKNFKFPPLILRNYSKEFLFFCIKYHKLHPEKLKLILNLLGLPFFFFLRLRQSTSKGSGRQRGKQAARGTGSRMGTPSQDHGIMLCVEGRRFNDGATQASQVCLFIKIH